MFDKMPVNIQVDDSDFLVEQNVNSHRAREVCAKPFARNADAAPKNSRLPIFAMFPFSFDTKSPQFTKVFEFNKQTIDKFPLAPNRQAFR